MDELKADRDRRLAAEQKKAAEEKAAAAEQVFSLLWFNSPQAHRHKSFSFLKIHLQYCAERGDDAGLKISTQTKPKVEAAPGQNQAGGEAAEEQDYHPIIYNNACNFLTTQQRIILPIFRKIAQGLLAVLSGGTEKIQVILYKRIGHFVSTIFVIPQFLKNIVGLAQGY